MSDFKTHIVSFVLTFISSFFTVFCGIIMMGDFTFSQEAITSAAVGAVFAATRTVAKLIHEYTASLLTRSDI